ncbi:helix-turn-helix transcriptional regulator [Cohnella xylanilytica]|uniref:Helix-turn-helix transcriptional regulator n=1 Tax=Cohnella xylanilytica TaxID=557555 RepID=A0A841TUP4_9BACL|nr:AraC family transcriptional regulator [Cohnella xylanilytica]MBB6691885.1 helix-turn-helix transcriptional regulator [Cohnella xylanilytica]
MLAMNTEYVPRIKLMGFVSYKAPWIHFRRTTDEHILYFIKSGELHLQENGTPHILRRGDVLLLEPHLEHEGLEKHLCDYYFVHFEHRDIRPWPEEDKLALAKRVLLEDDDSSEGSELCFFPKRFTFEDRNAFHRAQREMNEILALHRRKRYNRSLTALKWAEWMIETSREYWMSELQSHDKRPSRSYRKVNALLDYLHTHYTERITGEIIEKEFDCSYDYINRVFQEATGHTISRYANLVRINHAKELIEATHLSMNEIAYLTGLNDPFYFSKVFKKFVGLSPTQYYKKVRETMSM